MALIRFHRIFEITLSAPAGDELDTIEAHLIYDCDSQQCCERVRTVSKPAPMNHAMRDNALEGHAKSAGDSCRDKGQARQTLPMLACTTRCGRDGDGGDVMVNVIHPSKHYEIRLSLRKTLRYPATTATRLGSACAILRRKGSNPSVGKEPRQDSNVESPWCRRLRPKGGQRWIALEIPSAKVVCVKTTTLPSRCVHTELASSVGVVCRQP